MLSSAKRWLVQPRLVILLLAPFFGEGLSGSSAPLALLVPWHLAYMIALYGCGALICREVVHRFQLGFTGLCLLGAAYGVYEEAIVDRYWFFPEFWEKSGVGDYSVVWHTNILLATHLTAFHTAVSICLSVLVVERLFPAHRDQRWVGTPGLLVASVALAITPFIYGEFDQRPPLVVLVAATALAVGLVTAAFVLGRRTRRPREWTIQSPRPLVGTVAFLAVLGHWVATYGVPESELPWPVGVAISLLPLVLGALVVRMLATSGPYGRDGVRVAAGVISFFILLDLVVGVNGQYDMLVSAIATAIALRVWYVRQPRPTRA